MGPSVSMSIVLKVASSTNLDLDVGVWRMANLDEPTAPCRSDLVHRNEGGGFEDDFRSITMIEAAINGKAWAFQRNHEQKGLGVTNDGEALSLACGFVSNLLKPLGINEIYELKLLHRQSEKLLRLMCQSLRKPSIRGLSINRAVIKAVKNGKDGNNILHMVATLEPSARRNTVPGAAFLMQREVQWFKGKKKNKKENRTK
ncbi:ankyrin repeat-containing protein npr4 [Fagus crenata]